MLFHCLGLPHTISNSDYVACAYTQKVVKFIKMMSARGHTCIHYGHPDSVVDCENVPVITRETFERVYGEHDTKADFFDCRCDNEAYREHQINAGREIAKRKKSKGEFILSFWSVAGEPVCHANPDLIPCEPGIGYAGPFIPNSWKAFESYSLFHQFYGFAFTQEAKMDWHNYVIPNYFDPDDFAYRDGGDYLLFLGRIYQGKGVHIVIQLAEQMPYERFVIAGQNRAFIDELYGPGKPNKLPENIEIHGHANHEQRRELLKNAKGLICLSKFLEPFGGVAVEAMMSGTPAISSDWGAFTETNMHGRTGYRVRSFEQALWACRNIDRIPPMNCYQWAQNYTLKAIAPRFDEWFAHIHNELFSPKNWYTFNDNRGDLEHMTLEFPVLDERQNWDWMAHEEADMARLLAEWWKAQEWGDGLDAGCGPGHFVAALRAQGIPAAGFDIDARIDTKENHARGLRRYDLTKRFPGYGPSEIANVVLCLEVLEHIEPKWTRAALANLVALVEPGGLLIFSAAAPGQGGIGHINCRPKHEWQALLTSSSVMEFANEATQELVAYMQEHGAETVPRWFFDNVMIFAKC